MGERIVKVTVTAVVNSYLNGMDQVAKKSREGRTEAEQLTKKLEAQKKAFEVTGRTLMVGGGLVAAGLVLATKRAADFDQAMSNVAATGEDARGSIAALRDAAIEAGAETVYSATESAAAIEELAKAGVSAKDILGGGLTGSLDLAAAGGIGVAQAAEIASNSLNQFKLKGSDATHVADVLAAGAGKASGGVEDLGMALTQTGQVAAATGLSIEETTAGLAAFASAGLKGSDAGTSFKTMLGALTPNSQRAADEMNRLGIRAFDAQGKFIGLEAFAGNLRESLKGLTDEQRQASLEIMFGSDAVRAGIELYNQGADGIRKWTAAVDDQGYAAETAATRLDNLNGDLEKLSGAFDSALISLGESGQGPLRVLVQNLTEIVDGFNDMPEGGQAAVYWIGAVAAAAALGGGTFLMAVPKVAAYRVAITELGEGAQRTSRALGSLARAGVVGAVAATAVFGVDALAESISKNLLPSAEQIDNKMRNAKSGVDLFAAALNKEGIANTQQAATLLKGLGAELDAVANSDFFHPASTSGSAVTVANQLAEIANSGDMALFSAQFRQLAADADLTDRQLRTFIAANPELEKALTKQASAAGLAADRQSLLNVALGKNAPEVESSADAYQRQAEEIDGVRQSMRDLFDQINAQNSVEQQAIQANADWVAGLAALTEAVEANGASLDETTAAGSVNAAMLAGLAADAQTAAAAQYEVDQKTMSAKEASDKYQATLAAQRKKFEEAATAAGFNADEVKRLADKVFGLPTEREVKIIADVSQASAAIDGLRQRFDGTVITLKARIAAGASDAELAGLVGVGIPSRAGGGILPGPPSSQDNMLAHVASGEFIVKASQVVPPENRRVLEYINAGGRMRGYANGGFVQPSYASSRSGLAVGVTRITIAPVVHAAPNMDEDALANKVVRKVEAKLK